jgi:galactonate dehydratase
VTDYLVEDDVFDPSDGFLRIPEQPGLGVAVDEERLRAADEPDWHNPVWRHEDGSVAEW